MHMLVVGCIIGCVTHLQYYAHEYTVGFTCSLVVEVVPQLNAVLSRMITQLGAIKHENMQWVFSYG